MKKVFQMALLCAVMLIGFSSCEREYIYTITNKDIDDEYFIYEYNSLDEKVDTKNAFLKSGDVKAFVANKNATKLKIYFPDLKCWVDQVYYLERNLDIVITGETLVNDFEP